MLIAGKKESRNISEPQKFADYWDMNIPTEFYEEEFLEFEDYMHLMGNIKETSKESPHANSEYHLEMFKKYEKFVQKENKKLMKKQREQTEKSKSNDSQLASSKSRQRIVKVLYFNI